MYSTLFSCSLQHIQLMRILSMLMILYIGIPHVILLPGKPQDQKWEAESLAFIGLRFPSLTVQGDSLVPLGRRSGLIDCHLYFLHKMIQFVAGLQVLFIFEINGNSTFAKWPLIVPLISAPSWEDPRQDLGSFNNRCSHRYRSFHIPHIARSSNNSQCRE